MRSDLMKRFHYFIQNKSYKIALLIVISLFVLYGCQNTESTVQEAQYFTLPEVNQKYEDDLVIDFNNRISQNDTSRYEGLLIPSNPILQQPEQLPGSLFYDSGVKIAYPEDGVKGIYLTAENVADPEFFNYIIDYISQTELNAVVIDFKDDWGNIIHPIETDNPLIQQNVLGNVDFTEVMKVLEEHQIYPIARIVTFKDALLAQERPDLSFHDMQTGETWTDDSGAMFTNPFDRETWDYVLTIAEEAAKLGFKDIQFDYIRFPEGFEVFSDELEYNIGEYASFLSEEPDQKGIERVAAINDFLVYANNRLVPYGVDISVDVFGYTAIAGNAPDVRGIGQNFAMMADRVDVVSSMIYPSHWTNGFFGFDYPDLYPYEFTDAYMQEEEYVLRSVDNNVTTRPWLQDFTASYLPWGTYLEYGPNEVQEQINALYNNGIYEFLLWNASGYYTEGVDYNPGN